MLDKFLRWLDDDTGLSTSTIANYSRVAKYLYKNKALFNGSSVDDFKDFRRYKRDVDKTSAENLRKYTKVAKQWNKCFNLGWEDNLKLPKVKRHRQPTPPFDTVMEFLEQDTGEMWNMFWFIHINCGTRPSEVKNLCVEDIDLEQRCFYPKETKEDDGSAIIVFDWLIDEVRKYCHKIGRGYLFSSVYSKGKSVSSNAVGNDCRKRLQMIGCKTKYTPHSFRRAFATIAHIKGRMPLVMVQRLLRHKSITVTEGYINGDPDYVREAANMHPFNHEHCEPEIIVKEVESYIRNKLKDKKRFKQDIVRQIGILLYSAIK